MDEITAEDIAEANEERITQLAVLARYAAVVAVVAGAVGCLAWGWYAVHSQVEAGGGRFSFGDGDGGITLAQRLDLLASSASLLVQGAIAVALGAVTLLWSSQVLAAHAVSLHGVRVGDAVPTLEPDEE